MQQIPWDGKILGADGKERTRSEIEGFFIDTFYDKIKENLENFQLTLNNSNSTPGILRDLQIIIRYLKTILLAQPKLLEQFRLVSINRESKYISEFIAKGKTKDESNELITDYRKGLWKAFNYSGYRDALLNRLAVILNVKSCLYCNQQYTIAIGKSPNKSGKISLWGSKSYLQFDHFFNESKYPVMSMSLYNLIPSCPLCNQKKSDKDYSLSIHPYETSIADRLKFKIVDPNALILSLNTTIDLMEVEIETFGDKELETFVADLDLAQRYARHLDLVYELECAWYLEHYYDRNFKIISNEISTQIKDRYDENILHRYLKGFYPSKEDINRRPLTKFCQDIYDQLIGND